ncbi:hypothetical protein SAY87_012763 [Trapa incisa]|uniref:Uncharacterized protein n=1 Tax=Trapa incisa TaxID=236973 RepID=A0AAN7JCC9_9MYRT|nr:hypothetical protein SAY87_012763 [Trapa incisa]
MQSREAVSMELLPPLLLYSPLRLFNPIKYTIRQRSRGKSKCYGSASVGCCEVRRRQASVFTQGRPVAGAAGE